MEDRARWLRTAIRSAFAAGKAILEVYNQKELRVEKKADDSPLTLADRRAHSHIMKAIDGFGIPVLSEEGREIPFRERKAWPRLWIVDPLDGTKEFIKRNGEFTVNIALAEDGIPTMGVIYAPVPDLLYFSDHTIGAFRLDNAEKNGLGENRWHQAAFLRLLTEKARRLPMAPLAQRTYTIMGSRSHATPELEAYVDEMRQKFGKVEFVAAGSSLKICKVAEGRADVYPRLGPTMEWDTAAGQAIAVASGAVVVRHDSGQPLTYNKENLLNPWFVVQRLPTAGEKKKRLT